MPAGRSSLLALHQFPEVMAGLSCPQSDIDHDGQPNCQQMHRRIVEVVGRPGFGRSASELPKRLAMRFAEDQVEPSHLEHHSRPPPPVPPRRLSARQPALSKIRSDGDGARRHRHTECCQRPPRVPGHRSLAGTARRRRALSTIADRSAASIAGHVGTTSMSQSVATCTASRLRGRVGCRSPKCPLRPHRPKSATRRACPVRFPPPGAPPGGGGRCTSRLAIVGHPIAGRPTESVNGELVIPYAPQQGRHSCHGPFPQGISCESRPVRRLRSPPGGR